MPAGSEGTPRAGRQSTSNRMGRLYLIPSPLGESSLQSILPREVIDKALELKYFVVEEIRTARRFLSAAGLKGHIDELEFTTLNEHTSTAEVEAMAALFDKGDVGLISEAGLPAVADPGASLVALCHRRGIEVIPLVGPSSLMLALMASGLNGQSFAFNGYLPAKPAERRQALRAIESRSCKENQTQIFIETPYRNDVMLNDILSVCKPQTRLCIAADITMPDQMIRTADISQWKKSAAVIGKRPCVFLLLG
mgnify:CR=1 FL=1